MANRTRLKVTKPAQKIRSEAERDRQVILANAELPRILRVRRCRAAEVSAVPTIRTPISMLSIVVSEAYRQLADEKRDGADRIPNS